MLPQAKALLLQDFEYTVKLYGYCSYSMVFVNILDISATNMASFPIIKEPNICVIQNHYKEVSYSEKAHYMYYKHPFPKAP